PAEYSSKPRELPLPKFNRGGRRVTQRKIRTRILTLRFSACSAVKALTFSRSGSHTRRGPLCGPAARPSHIAETAERGGTSRQAFYRDNPECARAYRGRPGRSFQ